MTGEFEILISTMLPRVAVIIVSYNSRQDLPDCLSSLAAMTYPRDRWVEVVVDNGSTDGSATWVREHYPAVTVLAGHGNIGYVGGNNLGIAWALERGFDYVYLLNPDTIVVPDFLTAAVAVAQAEGTVGAVQSKLLLHPDRGLVNSWGNELHFLGFGYSGGYRRPDRPLPVREIAYPSGAAMLLPAVVLRHVGALDERLFLYHEDLELGWRLWISGERVLLAPGSVVYHRYEFARSVKNYYYMERNRYLVLLSHYRLGTLVLLLPALVAVGLAMIAISMRRGYWREEISAHLYFLRPSAWVSIVRRRRVVQRLRRVPDRKIVHHFTAVVDFQELPNRALVRFGNVLLTAYWAVARKLIWW